LYQRAGKFTIIIIIIIIIFVPPDTFAVGCIVEPQNPSGKRKREFFSDTDYHAF